jgi:crotonobetainyl-CoA:carnitine CoA-transferase CaiB-like acyl-CoA transferase
MSQVASPLSGYVVVDLSSGIAGSYCTKLLADGGADVVKVEPPEGDALRSWSASGVTITDRRDGALFSFLSCSKQSVIADPDEPTAVAAVTELLEGADAVVWSRGSRLAEHTMFTPAVLRRQHPHLTVTSITPFGLDGPWRDRPATEFTLQAWSGGIIGLGRGWPDRPPAFVGGQVGEWLAGAYAAVGTLVARRRTVGGTGGELVDVSMLEALASSLTYFPVTFFDALRRPFREGRGVPTPGVADANDGLVGLGVGTGQQWVDFCTMVGHPEWADDESLFMGTERARLAPMIDEWTGSHTVNEICELATAFRLPNAPIGNGANLPTTEHFVQRGTFVRNPRDEFCQPGPPYRIHPACLRPPEPPPALGEHTNRPPVRRRARSPASISELASNALPFADLRVLDMTAFWAGPLCTHVLALLGAEVIHLESISRVDGTRKLGAPLTEDQWWERSPIFSGLNTNKKSVTLDFQTERGHEVLRRLIASCDVLVENYTPRVLEQAGLTFDAVRDIRDDIIMVRMPGFGLDGPWRDATAFAFVIEDASGLTWLTGHPDQSPLQPYCIGDPNAGIHALMGLLLGLEYRGRTGDGVLVEAAMIDAAINVTAEQVIEYSASGALLERAGNRGPAAAPQNLYLTAGADELGHHDCWIAIAIATDEQWKALTNALGEPDWTLDPMLATTAGRRQHHDLIDEHLAAWCRHRSAHEIIDRLWNEGIPVARVMEPHRQVDLPQLQARRFFEVVDHPISGPARHSALPIRFSRGSDQLHLRHAPLLGEHNRELLAELGISASEVAALEADGVIGQAPVRG